MSVKAYTSRSRFDEQRRFTGVYQQMGRVSLDSDWNEEVRLRTVDARRRSADLAEGSPDDGFRIVGDHLIDPITTSDGWVGQGLASGDERIIKRELRLDRRDPESLPWVVRARGWVALRRSLPTPLDLTHLPIAGDGSYAAAALVFALRFDRPPTDDEIVDVRVVVADSTGAEVSVPAGLPQRPDGWQELRVPVSALAGIDLTRVARWGVTGLPPIARTWIAALRAEDAGLGNDVIIRGGDGTLPGAGRLFVEGVRVFLEQDRRYSLQPDLPDPQLLAALPADGSLRHFFYLDVWEQTVTSLDDEFLIEPALDGLDTTARLRLISQVRVRQNLAAGERDPLPVPTGGGRLTTNVPQGALPDRYPPEPIDPCRDRCLFSENVSTGEGFVGADNLNVRVEIFRGGEQPVIVWSRDNASTVLPLVAPTAADSLTLQVAPVDAARLRAGDLVVIEDRITRLQPEGTRLPVLRRLRGVDTATGTLELEDARYVLTASPTALSAGGPVGRVFAPEQGAAVRRWDGGDLLLTGVRYRLNDGITFSLSGDGFRAGDYWSFTARVRAPDGAARGVVEQLNNQPVHGPVHHFVPLARVTATTAGTRVFEDLRPRFLPLGLVRDRLRELDDRVTGPGAFTVVVGDGVRSFGDIDQDLAEGVTGDEALQAALDRLGSQGGTIYVRGGRYKLEHPVLLRSVSSLVILGDGDASELRVQGSGGAFYLDRCGTGGKVELRDLNLIEAPFERVDIGRGEFPRPFFGLDTPVRTLPVLEERPVFERVLAARFAPLALPPERPLVLDDLRAATSSDDFLARTSDRLRIIGPGEGRAAASVVATLIQLRRLQRQNPGRELDEVAEAQPLLAALEALPHGIVTIADSHQVSITRCRLQANRPGPEAAGVLITGTCEQLVIDENRIFAAAGVVAAPYAPYLAGSFLSIFPRAGLFLSDLEILENFIQAAFDGATGVHVADGVLSGVVVRNNRVAGFAVGLLIEDLAEGGTPHAVDRMLVAGNQITGAQSVGIQITGDGVDVADNEVRNASSAGLFQVGIQLAGTGLRVRNCWVEIPATPLAPVVGVVAGIVIGDGMDDGQTVARPVLDVEVMGNRIEGAGEASGAIGLLIGGPQPIYDVRVHGNVIRNLGDAGVRVWGSGGPVGRLRIEGNRLEKLALADVPPQADVRDALILLDGAVAAALGQSPPNRPRALLEALLATSTQTVRAPLDATLRWLERLSLRGAVVLGNVDESVVQGNRIGEVGRLEPFAAPGLDAEIRTAAIAVVAGSDVLVQGNQIDDVRAPVDAIDVVPPPTPPIFVPPIFDVIRKIGVAVSESRLDRNDVHLAVVSMRNTLLEYAGADEEQQQILSRSMFGPLDTVAQELQNLGGRTVGLGATLAQEVNEIRSAQGAADQVRRANIARATLSQAASFTAPDDRSQDAWDTAAQIDLAMVNGTEAVSATARRLRTGLEAFAVDLPGDMKTVLGTFLSRLVETPSQLPAQLAVSSQVAQVAAVRDLQAQRDKQAQTGELFGPRRTIVRTFADSALAGLDGISADASAENAEIISNIKDSKDALVDQLRQANSGLADDVEADFRDVDRTRGTVGSALTRLRATLTRVKSFSDGASSNTLISSEDTARLSAQARAAAVNLHVANLDKHVGGLVNQSEDTVEKGLRSFSSTLDQLVELVGSDPELQPLASDARDAIGSAIAQPARRTALVSSARSLLDQIKIKTGDIIPVARPPERVLVDPIDRRLAGLGSLVLTMRGLAPGDALAQALDLFRAQLERVLDLVGIEGRSRELALHASDDAKSVLLAGAADAVAAEAYHRLASEVESVASAAVGGGSVPAQVDAAAVLLRALTQVLDPGEAEAARLARVQAYLQQRGNKLAASVVAQLGAAAGLAELVGVLARTLERLARGEEPTPADFLPTPIDRLPRHADGVFVAGVQTSVQVAQNQVRGVTSGITVLGVAGHLLTEQPAQEGLSADIGENHLTACAVQAIRFDAGSSVAAVIADNHVYGSAGVATPEAGALGHAVASFAGDGNLVLRNNVFQENGNTGLGVLLHEILIDWRGEVVVRGNTLRHNGGGLGGAALLVVTETIDASLVARLARAPFLASEPAPRPRGDGRPPISVRPPLDFGTVDRLASVPRAEDLVQLGGLKQRFASAPVLNRALTLARPAPAATAASSLAARFLTPVATVFRPPIIDIILRPPILIPPIRVPTRQRVVHIEGNDVEASGPALLLLCSDAVGFDASLIAASVVANELRSLGRAGAVYLRHTDSTVFNGNRCQSIEAVNVVVLRVGRAPVSASGNVLLGAEPVTPPTPPIYVPQRPLDRLTISVPVGGGSSISVPLDEQLLLGGLERRKQRASDTFANLLTELATAPPTTGGTTTPPTSGTPPATGGGSTPPIFDPQGPNFVIPSVSFEPSTPGGGDPSPEGHVPGDLLVHLTPETLGDPSPETLAGVRFDEAEVRAAFADLVAAGFAPNADTAAANAQPTPEMIAALTESLNSGTLTASAPTGAGATRALRFNLPVTTEASGTGAATPGRSVNLSASGGRTVALSPSFVGSLSGALLKKKLGGGGAAGNLPGAAPGLPTHGANPLLTRIAFDRGLAGGLFNESTLAALEAKAPVGVSANLALSSVYTGTLRNDRSQVGALKDLVDKVALHVGDDEDPTAKIKTALNLAGGDPKKALEIVDKQILGVSSAAPTVRASLTNVSVLHEVLADAFYGGGGTASTPIIKQPPPLPSPPPPDPNQHSLVIIGGSRVAAVGNATTAGVHVQEADAVVELNP
jgi:hypothetical protein